MPSTPRPTPRLVATDLDGTLLHSDGTVTERTRRVLAAVEELGVTVVFVTGRPVRWMGSLWEHVGDHGLAICSNGGIVYDVPAQEVVHQRTIPRDIGLEVARRIRTALPGSFFALERPTGFAREDTFPVRPDRGSDRGSDRIDVEVSIGPLTEVYGDDVVKMLSLHQDHDPLDYWAQVEELVGGLVTTTWSSTGALVEMSGSGVTKASTLELVCAERGIDSADVVAFGDMPNDVAMLAWAGTSYAMGNAHEVARNAAGRLAPRNDEDGVAVVLEQLFLG